MIKTYISDIFFFDDNACLKSYADDTTFYSIKGNTTLTETF